MRVVRFAIFYFVYDLIGNRRAVLPSSATALLYEEKKPTSHAASSRGFNPEPS
jgi:hypothetical protein